MYPSNMGAITPMYAGTCPELKGGDSGGYFIPWARRGRSSKETRNVVLAMRLWEFIGKDVKRHLLEHRTRIDHLVK